MNLLKNLILQNFSPTRPITFNAKRDNHSLSTVFFCTRLICSKFSFTSQKPSLPKFSRNYNTNYKSPVNAGKSFKPQQIPVSKQNQHLLIQVFAQNNENLGVLSLQQAKEKATNANLKLVMIDEAPNPPHAKLLSGKELYELQMKSKGEKEEQNNPKILKEKEVDINLGIDEHDLEIKIKMIKNFIEKGHTVTVKIDSKIKNKKVIHLTLFQHKEKIEFLSLNCNEKF